MVLEEKKKEQDKISRVNHLKVISFFLTHSNLRVLTLNEAHNPI